MLNLEEVYTFKFFRTRWKTSWRAPIICSAIDEVLSPLSIIDVGCSIGDMIKTWHAIGKTANGIEGSPCCKDYLVVPEVFVRTYDLRTPIMDMPVYDLVTCFEVAEHIEAEYSGVFVDNLTRLSSSVLITAAGVGQEGHSHVNCQPKSYWVDLFGDRGFQRDALIEEKLISAFGPIRRKRDMAFIHYNLMFFKEVGDGLRSVSIQQRVGASEPAFA